MVANRAVWSKRLRRAQRVGARRLPERFQPAAYWASPTVLRVARRLQTSLLFGGPGETGPLLRGQGLEGYVAAAGFLIDRTRLDDWRSACSRAMIRVSDTFSDRAQIFRDAFEASQQAAPQTRIWAKGKTFVVAVHSRSPADILGIADALASGLIAAGAQCSVLDERDAGRILAADYPLVVAPHTFFSAGATAALRSKRVLKRLILYNTEPLESPGFLEAMPYLFRARAVFDLGFNASESVQGRLPATYLPPPFDAEAVTQAVARTDPSHPLLRWADRSAPATPSGNLEDRDLDLVFRGVRSPRVGQILIRTAPYLADKVCVIDYVRDPGVPANGTPDEIAANARSALHAGVTLAVRSRIRLNAHPDRLASLDWQGSYAQGLACGACVITSPVLESPFLQSGVHYIESSTRNLDRVIAWSLDDPEGRERASGVAAAGRRVAHEVLSAGRVGQYALAFLRGLK